MGGMQNHYENHFMACSKCGKQLRNKLANRAVLRENMESHKASGQCGANAICTHPSCGRIFSHFDNKAANQNSMEQHRQVHNPKNVSCPLCGAQRFRSAANSRLTLSQEPAPTARARRTRESKCTNSLPIERTRDICWHQGLNWATPGLGQAGRDWCRIFRTSAKSSSATGALQIPA